METFAQTLKIRPHHFSMRDKKIPTHNEFDERIFYRVKCIFVQLVPKTLQIRYADIEIANF